MIERQKLNLEARKLYRQLNSVSENKEELTVELMEVQKMINFLTVNSNMRFEFLKFELLIKGRFLFQFFQAKYDSIKSEPLKLDEENAKIEIELR